MKFLNVKNRAEAVNRLKGVETFSYFAEENENILTVEDSERNYLFEIEGGDGLNGVFESTVNELSLMEKEAKR